MRLVWQIQRAAAFDMANWSKAVASLLREEKAREGCFDEDFQDSILTKTFYRTIFGFSGSKFFRSYKK